jgi:hypothetical protein
MEGEDYSMALSLRLFNSFELGFRVFYKKEDSHNTRRAICEEVAHRI